MSVLPRHHQQITSAASDGRPRGGALAMAAALMLALSACSPGPDNGPAPVDGATTTVVESESSPTDAEDSPGTEPDTQEERSAEGEDAPAPTPTPDGTNEQDDEDTTETASPASFEIPAIDASSELLHLGLRENGTLEVPPGAPGSPASWYTGSPAPGEQGPSVLLGHVDDSLGEPGVFAALPELIEGDEITVVQEDGGVATFVVTKAEQYGKNTFPTLEVYGNTEEPELRLITCDGYDQSTGEYEDNYVVYATLAD